MCGSINLKVLARQDVVFSRGIGKSRSRDILLRVRRIRSIHTAHFDEIV